MVRIVVSELNKSLSEKYLQYKKLKLKKSIYTQETRSGHILFSAQFFWAHIQNLEYKRHRIRLWMQQGASA